MKKYYQAPHTDVVQFKPASLLAASDPKILQGSGEVDGGSAMSHGKEEFWGSPFYEED
ncbi:MAG: hypothetical protein ACI353_04830 [Alloprevotella sp.]